MSNQIEREVKGIPGRRHPMSKGKKRKRAVLM